MKSTRDMLNTADRLSVHLEKRGVRFDDSGFPLIETSCFLDDLPEAIVPYSHRKSKMVRNPKKTVVCFYMRDSLIYPRFDRLFDDLPEYGSFMGVVEPDITVTRDMDIEWQQVTMLLNRLFIACIAIEGIKVLPNLRSGLPCTWRFLQLIPRNATWVSSSLGCPSLAADGDDHYEFLSKVLSCYPSHVLLYGKRDRIAESQLERMGIAYSVFPDFHTASKVGT